jgi:hypothetical protein
MTTRWNDPSDKVDGRDTYRRMIRATTMKVPRLLSVVSIQTKETLCLLAGYRLIGNCPWCNTLFHHAQPRENQAEKLEKRKMKERQ